MHHNVITPDRVRSVLSVVEKGLRSARARKIQINEESIVFRGGIFRLVSSMNLLVGVTKGRISAHIEPNAIKLDYELWFTELLVGAIVLSCFFGVGGLVMWQVSSSNAVCVGLLAFVWFFGMNMIITMLRFRAFLGGCARQSDSSMP